MPPTTFTSSDPRYPTRLRALPRPPAVISTEGAALDAPCVVAIVGTRDPTLEAARFAFDLGAAVAQAGAVVASGGALGVDTEAHRGALSVQGRTWAILPCGARRFSPPSNAPLFEEIVTRGGALVWPFAPGSESVRGRFLYRNGVLVALADVVVAVQAPAPSGTLNTAAWARDLRRPLWAVCGPPWDPRFAGSRQLVDLGARVVTSLRGFIAALELPESVHLGGAQMQLGLPSVARSASTSAAPLTDPIHTVLFGACSSEPRHVDEIAMRARVCASTAAIGLLTLALENVLLEGPEGFYRREN